MYYLFVNKQQIPHFIINITRNIIFSMYVANKKTLYNL